MAIKPIQILINAKDDASAVFDKLQTKVAAVGVAILGYFGVQAFAGVVKGAADLEQAMSRVKAATGATAEEMKALRQTAEDAGANTSFSAVQAANALENLAKSGLSASDAIKTLPAVMQLAQAGDIDLATSAEYVTKAINGLGLSFGDAGRVADVLAKGANATNTSVTGLAQALSYAAPLANTLGLSLEQTVAIIGKFADAGIDASRAGTALNAILAQFSDPASKFRTELAGAGITTTDFGTALRELAKSGPIGQRAINAVGTEAGPALRALLNQGIGKLDELTESLKNAKGSAAATAAVMQANLNGAFDQLAKSWDTLKNALGTPVLPVLQAGVEKLTGALRSAVADGTVAKFGQAIATGFRGAIEWVQKFAASFDWDATVARLQAFAGQAQQTFEQVGKWARDAGNEVRLAYGVMSTGANTVMAVIYKIAEAFAGVSRDVALGIAALNDGLARVTFGQMSENFRKEADAVREVAAGLTGVTDAFAKKSEEAFAQANAGAAIAAEGWDGVAGSATAATAEIEDGATAFEGMATQLRATAQAASTAAEKTNVASDALGKQAEGASAARDALDRLRAEYAGAVSMGAWQLAAETMEKIRVATKGAGDQAAASAKDIEAAFSRMGVQTKESLRVVAEVAKRDFEVIRDSGQATATGVSEAWKKMAEAAIAAADGIAPPWVQAQAAMRGYAVATDQAGKAVLQLTNAQSGLQQSNDTLANSISSVSSQRERDIALQEKQIELTKREQKIQEDKEALERKRLGVDQAGFSADKSGNRIVAGSDLMSLTGIAAFLKAAGVEDDKTARNIAREFADTNGNVTYMGNAGQKKYGGDTISVALLRAAERYTFGIGGNGVGASPSTIPKPDSTRTVRVNLNLNGRDFGGVSTDDAGANQLQGFLEELQRAKSVSRH